MSAGVHWCERLLEPRSVAIVGAGGRSTSMGSRYLANLRAYGFRGSTYAVSRRSAGDGVYASVADLPEAVDLCQVAVPYAAVPEVVADCAQAGVGVVQVLTAPDDGGADGQSAAIRAALDGSATRLVGPNCVGTHAPAARLTFLPRVTAAPGSVAIVSQSGGLAADLVYQAESWGVGLRGVASIGNCLDADATEFLDYLAGDPATSAVGLYLEGVNAGRDFLAAVARTAAAKPVFVLKGGTSAVGGAAVFTHTGAIAGDHAVWQAALEQHGAVLVDSPDRLLAALAAAQAGAGAADGRQAAMVGNGGGMTVLMSDALAAADLQLAELDARTRERMAALDVPAGAVVGSATDIPGGAISSSPETLSALLRTVTDDPGVAMVFAHFNLSALATYANRVELVDGLVGMLREARTRKPVFLGLRATGDPSVESLRRALVDACAADGIPSFPGGVAAIEAVRLVLTARERQAAVRAAPAHRARTAGTALWDSLRWRVDGDVASLGHRERVRVLEHFGIAQEAGVLARSADEAAAAADAAGYPVVCKLEAAGLVHKTERGGVRLGIEDERALRDAYAELVAAWDGESDGVLVQRQLTAPAAEMLLAARWDPTFGPVVVVGSGGILVELVEDVCVRVAPLSREGALEALDGLRSRPLLHGFRGRPPADVPALATAIERMSELALELRPGVEVECNPVIVNPQGGGVSAVDCRVLRTAVPEGEQRPR